MHPSVAVFEYGNNCEVCDQPPAADVLIKGELHTLCHEHLLEAQEES